MVLTRILSYATLVYLNLVILSCLFCLKKISGIFRDSKTWQSAMKKILGKTLMHNKIFNLHSNEHLFNSQQVLTKKIRCLEIWAFTPANWRFQLKSCQRSLSVEISWFWAVASLTKLLRRGMKMLSSDWSSAVTKQTKTLYDYWDSQLCKQSLAASIWHVSQKLRDHLQQRTPGA